VIRYDHRDTGGSTVLDYPEAPYTLEELTDDALAVLDGYGLERANVMGLSMGGDIAQILAARSPERVEKLILLSTTVDHRPYMTATTGNKGEKGSLPPPMERFLSGGGFNRFGRSSGERLKNTKQSKTSSTGEKPLSLGVIDLWREP